MARSWNLGSNPIELAKEEEKAQRERMRVQRGSGLVPPMDPRYRGVRKPLEAQAPVDGKPAKALYKPGARRRAKSKAQWRAGFTEEERKEQKRANNARRVGVNLAQGTVHAPGVVITPDGLKVRNGRVVGRQYPYRRDEKYEVEAGASAWEKYCADPAGWDWKRRLAQIIRDNAHVRFNDEGQVRYASDRTREERAGLVRRLFTYLVEDRGMRIDFPCGIDSRHLTAWRQWLEQKYLDGSYETSTIAGYCTAIRTFCLWINQPNLPKWSGFEDIEESVTRRRLIAQKDHSWEGSDVDFDVAVRKAMKVEPWVAMALIAQGALGLRRTEAIMLRPFEDFVPEKGALMVTRGAKGGRERVVLVDTPGQIAVLGVLMAFVNARQRGASIADGALSLEQAKNRYSNVLKGNLGITKELVGTTGHGLRAGYACRLLEALGFIPPVRGGDLSQAEGLELKRAKRLVSEALGHSRIRVTGAYIGARPAKGAPQAQHHGDVQWERVDQPGMAAVVGLMEERIRRMGSNVAWPGAWVDLTVEPTEWKRLAAPGVDDQDADERRTNGNRQPQEGS